MNQEIDNEEIVIDVTELFKALRQKLYLILMVGVLTAMLTFWGIKAFVTPMYTSVTKIYIWPGRDKGPVLTQNDLKISTSLAADYRELMKSRSVLQKVIIDLDLDMSPQELWSNVSIETIANTRMLNIIVQNEEPELAKKIADAIREAVGIRTPEVMGGYSVFTVEEASSPSVSNAPAIKKDTIYGGMIGLFCAIAVLVMGYLMDDSIKSPKDVEQHLGMSVLASISMEKRPKNLKPSERLSLKKRGR